MAAEAQLAAGNVVALGSTEIGRSILRISSGSPYLDNSLRQAAATAGGFRPLLPLVGSKRKRFRMPFRRLRRLGLAGAGLVAMAGSAPAQQAAENPYEQGRRIVQEGIERARRQAKDDFSKEAEDPERLRLQDERSGYRRDVQEMMREALKWPVAEGSVPSERNIAAAGFVYNYLVDNLEFERAAAAARIAQDVYATSRRRYEQLRLLAQEPLSASSVSAVAAYVGPPRRTPTALQVVEEGLLVRFRDGEKEETVTLRDPKAVLAEAMGYALETVDQDLAEAAASSRIGTPR